MHDRRPTAIRLLQVAQSGLAPEALAAAEAEIAVQAARRDEQPTVDGHPAAARETWERASGWLPSLHYVRGVAQHWLGDHAAARVAAADIELTAQTVDNGAWLCVGRTFAVLQDIAMEPSQDLTSGDPLLRQLASAEADLPERFSEPFALVSAHTTIGRCYMALRLYELALPHFLRASEVIDANPELMRVARVTMQLNLAELHLGWSIELRLLAGHEAATEHEAAAEHEAATEHEAAALMHARRAESTPALEETSAFRAKGALMAAFVDNADEQPQQSVDRIQAAMEALAGRGQRVDRAMALMYQARALARGERLQEALAAGREACDVLPDDAFSTLSAGVLHTRAQLQSRISGDDAVLAYGDHLAQVLWRQRQRTLDMARSLQLLERIRRERDRIHTLAYTDGLTGIGNRHAFEDHISALVARPEDGVTVVIVDVDELKLANDIHGHEAGDDILRTIAEVLRALVGPGDVAVRLGGDEFVLVSCALGGQDVEDIAERIGAEIVLALAGAASVSVGAAHGRALDAAGSLLRDADLAMYERKRRRHERSPVTADLQALPSG